MSISDHLAVLVYSNLTRPRASQYNNTLWYDARLAFGGDARKDLESLLIDVYPAFDPRSRRNPIIENWDIQKPIEGLPKDALIVRTKTQFRPIYSDEDGCELEDDQVDKLFSPGAYVRALIDGYTVEFKAKDGTEGRQFGFNLNGLMLAGDGIELKTGGYVNRERALSVFSKYARAEDRGSPGPHEAHQETRDRRDSSAVFNAPREPSSRESQNPFRQRD